MIVGLAFSQASQTCTISGVVRTSEGNALPGVIVLLRSPVLFAGDRGRNQCVGNVRLPLPFSRHL